MTEESSTSRAYESPLRLLIIIAASVFITEACVMILLAILPTMPHFVAAPIDAFLVTLIIYPVLYRYVVRPMNQHIAERQKVETALRRAHDELELRVNERTSELAQANESLQVEIVERQRAGEDLQVALNQVQQRQAEMAGLLAGARAVLEYRDFAEIAQTIFEACRSTVGATAGYVALPTEDQSHEKPMFSNLGERTSTPDMLLPMPIVGLRQQAYVTGKTAYTNDPGYCECAQLLPGGHLPLNNVLFAPMKIKGFVVGTLGLANKSDGFSEDDARLATAFAELAAIAVLNSQTIELLESSERRFRTLAQATFEGIAISEEDIIREANEQYAHMHGYLLPEVIGKPISDFLAPQDHERMRQAIAGDERHVGEYHALRKDGSVFPLEVRAYSTEQSGRAVRVAALRDITERKRAEEAIRARNALLSSIIESPDSAIFSIDREYRYTCFNRRHAYVMKSLFGVDIEIGRNLLDYHTVESDRQLAKQNLDRALSGESFVIEDWAGDDALTRRCFEISHSPVKDADQIIGAAVFAQDITERKYADQMLRENEEWLRMAFDAGDLGRWRFTAATGMLHFDERARVHAGLHHNMVSQAEALTYVHPDDRALLQEQTMSALNPAGQGRYAAEYRVRWPDGEMHWLDVQARVHFEGEGAARQPVLAVGISQDITARKQMEQALRESEERFRLALRNAPVSIAAQDRGLRFLWSYNQRAVDPKTVIGKTDTDLFPPEEGARLIALKRKVLETETEAREQLWLTSGGQRVFLDLYLEPMRDARGQVTGIGIATVDLTQMKLAEEALRESRRDLDRAQEVGQIGSWRLDVRRNVLTWSDENHRIFGVPKGIPMTYDTFLGSVHPDDREYVDRRWTAGLAGEPYDIEHRIIAAGVVKWVREKAYLEFDQDGDVLGGFGITQDITTRKQTEDRVTWLASFPELNPSPVVEVDLDGHTYYLNPAAKRLLPDLETAGQSHPWLADLELLSQKFQTDSTTVLTRETVFGDASYQQTLFCVPTSQRVRIYSLDITARKRAEAQLRLLSTALEATVNGVAVTDRQGQILWVNPAFTGLTGYSREEAVGQNPRLLKSGQHHVEFYQELWGKILHGQPWSGEIINRRKDGTLYFEEMTITPVRIGGDEITHFVAIKEDITARKQAEESLRQQAALIELSPDAIIVRSLEGIITFWSLGAATLYGWTEHEALGRHISGLLQPQLPKSLEQIIEQLKQTGRWSGEIVHHTRGGLKVIVQSWWLAQFNAQGDITEIFESNVDFTVRKQMEEQLRHNQVLLERRVLERTAELAAANNALRLQSAALQAAANGIVITDRQGNIQWANPALTEMTGYAAEEVLGQSTRLFRSGLKEPEFYQHLWNTILSGRVWRGELINRRKDGSLYVEEQTIAPVLNEYGKIANFVAVKQDVTERQEAQSRLEQNNRELLALSKAEHDQRQLAETLAEANLALTNSLDLETVLETLLDCVERIVPYDSANVMLLEAESRLAVRIARGYERWSSAEQVRAIAFDVQANPIINELVTTRRSRSVSDTCIQPGWESPPGVEHVRSWLGVPLVAGGNVIGLYSLDKTEPGYFSRDHIRKAEMLAGQAAVAVQNAWLFEQVRAGRERLQTLSRRLVESQEAERQYIARELHDEAGQALTSLLFGLGQIEQQTDSPGQAAQIAELRQTTNDIIESLHRLAMDLRPASLDHLGLVPALLQQVRVIGDRHGLIARFKAIGLEDERLPAEIETALYRIVQEALTNIVRHARATRVDVLLERRGNRIVVVVEDDGRGFDAEISRFMQEGHLGLAGMQERARTLGGSLIIESTAGIGTTLVVEVPYGNSYSDR